MSKTVTITLDEISENHFDEVGYSLDLPHKEETDDSDIINHCLTECKAFEDIVGDQITNYLLTNYPKEYKHWIKANNIKQY